jgi:hypothetical protein
MRVNTHILSGRRNSTKLADHAAVAASFNPHEPASKAFGIRTSQGTAELNRLLRFLGVTCLVCDNERVLGKLRSLAAGRPYEVGSRANSGCEKKADATFTAK